MKWTAPYEYLIALSLIISPFHTLRILLTDKQAPAEQPAPDTDAPAVKRKPRHKRKKPEDESQLPQEEVTRRRVQRQLRETALKLRAQGKEYNHNKHRRQALAEAVGGGLTDSHKPRRSVQLIIVPIFWNRREEEKSMVWGAAAQAQAALRAVGVKCDTDTTHKLTPGQKFRHWEEKGIMLRVEIGPQEAEAGVCLLAQSKTAGEVAEKRRVKLGGPLVEAVGEALGMKLDSAVGAAAAEGVATQVGVGVGVPISGGDAGFQQSKPFGGLSIAGKGTKVVFNDEDEEEEEEKGALKGAKSSKGGGVGPSGDDLDGDFDEAVLLGGGESEGGKKGKKGGDAEDWGAEGKTKKKKKQKNVTF